MILADKIINERKKNGWSQEELAEQLSVSRQSVSKWEGAQAVPDLQKILQMAEIFGVSTDYLLKDEMEPAEYAAENQVDVTAEPPRRMVSMEEASEYLSLVAQNAHRLANAVSLCILSPVLLIFLAGLSEEQKFGISENLAAGIGLIALFVSICAAVYIFITYGAKLGEFEYLEKQPFETAYGVNGMVGEKKKAYAGRHTSSITIGVILCIMCPIPLIIASLMEVPDYICVIMVCVLLIMVSAGVNMFVSSGCIWGSYQKLLQEGEFTVNMKKKNKKMELISSVYWCTMVAIYLGWSFWTMKWGITWIIWPVAGVFYGVVEAIAKIAMNVEE